MEDKEIKQTRRNLMFAVVCGVIVFVVSILFHRLGSKTAGPQTFWLFAGFFGAFFTFFSLIKLFKFRKYVQELKRGK